MNAALRSRYLNELGVPEFLHALPPRAKFAAPKIIKTRCLVLESNNSNSFCTSGNTQAFLLKMLAAIGLERSDIICATTTQTQLKSTLKQYQAEVVLLLGAGLSSADAQHFASHHPSAILQNAQLKREAWEVLKRMKLCLK